MNEIFWPERYTPGTTDNYVSNEIILAGLTAAKVWPYLNNTSAWPTYYSNVSDIHFHDGSGPELRQGALLGAIFKEILPRAGKRQERHFVSSSAFTQLINTE